MESDSDSDGSHISATPPSSPSTAPGFPPTELLRAAVLLSSTKSRTKTSASTSTHSRTILQPNISKKNAKPPNETDAVRPQPQKTLPVLSNLPFQIKKTANEDGKNALDGLLHGGHCASKFASFLKAQNKNLNFEADNSVQMKSEASIESAGLGEVVKDEVVGTGLMAKKLRKNLGLIGGNDSDVPKVKRARCVSEGNFVKLNINGYGRKKFTFKNKRTGFSSSNRRRKYRKSSKGSVGGGGEESGVLDEEGLVVDIGKGRERSKFDAELIEEAVMRVRNKASDENLLKLLKLTHGYDSFRDGQLEAVKMVLLGKSTMLVLPTGAGKSLCYQLPALVLPGLTLVVSPLVALMIDQLKQLPPAVQGGLLCSSQTAEEASETLRLLQEGAIKVLFVSPERFLNAEFISIFSHPSPLSLVVVDEAHCVSEWSHNFRPSYMRLRASLLRGKLNAGCILAMTATATKKTLCDVMHALDIPPANLIQSAKLRDNLHLSVSISGNRMKDLMALLKSSPFFSIKSIIIYCKFQSETDMISKYLCDNNISAKSYHSGIPAKDRSRVQDLFCANRIRVVVATVAFGMGLDKSDVGAVIHYSLPESLEEYVQEIGRAGRDGRLSYCHLLFDDATYFKLRSLMHSDGVDEYTVNKLLCQVFTSDGLATEGICSMVKESASRKFDMKEEVILTILTQLELGEVQYIHLLPQINVTCTLNFHQTPPPLLAAKDTVVAAILKKSEMKDGQYVFHIPSVANSIKMQPIDMSNRLQSLKLKGEITYELKDQAFCYTILKGPKDICSLAAQLTKWLGEVETCKVQKVDEVFNAASFAAKVCDNALGCCKDQHTPCLQKKILEYFNRDDDVDVAIQTDQNSPFLRADIKVEFHKFASLFILARNFIRQGCNLSSSFNGLGFSAKQLTGEIHSKGGCENTARTFQSSLSCCYLVKNSFLGKICTYGLQDSNGSSETRANKFCRKGCELSIFIPSTSVACQHENTYLARTTLTAHPVSSITRPVFVAEHDKQGNVKTLFHPHDTHS
ncbi:ATP-dependent DNA helicase Q-like 5 [Sesamum angolense]|uniref:DNA 3'-5' helicase n=1 Tax=Sesamum angolense TaxID=2727404 RepID=A0AAE2BYQ1_9LAMI|nr:ATP-dependent DNA helicase Q-like 5 [Sesamum angolense]